MLLRLNAGTVTPTKIHTTTGVGGMDGLLSKSFVAVKFLLTISLSDKHKCC